MDPPAAVISLHQQFGVGRWAALVPALFAASVSALLPSSARDSFIHFCGTAIIHVDAVVRSGGTDVLVHGHDRSCCGSGDAGVAETLAAVSASGGSHDEHSAGVRIVRGDSTAQGRVVDDLRPTADCGLPWPVSPTRRELPAALMGVGGHQQSLGRADACPALTSSVQFLI